MHIQYSYRKLHTLIFHAITCITCSSARWCLRDFRSSSGSSGSPVLATSVELVQVDTELSSLKTVVIMTTNGCSVSTFCVNYKYICYCFHFKSLLYAVIITVL